MTLIADCALKAERKRDAMNVVPGIHMLPNEE